ncbi:putative sugar transferase EpsL [Stigmatopora argus]
MSNEHTERATARLRKVDVAVTLATAPLWAPMLLVIAVAVLLSSGRPIFFCQDRIGQGSTPFRMRKFRSMKNGDNPLIPQPDRITPIGRLLRRTSLDELPQLLHVLGGSMSLVGPRPMLPAQADALSVDQARRHTVRPGLTGLAQVSGRNSLPWDERFVYDTQWADDPSMRLYCAILYRTVRTVATGHGVAGHSHHDRVVATAATATEASQRPGRNDASQLDLDQIHLTDALDERGPAAGLAHELPRAS